MFQNTKVLRRKVGFLAAVLIATSAVLVPMPAAAASYTLTCSQSVSDPNAPFSLVINNAEDKVLKESAKDCAGALTIPEGVKKIDFGAFVPWTAQNTPLGNDQITSISIPSSLTEIFAGGFINLSSVSNLVIPSNVITIGHQAFQGMTALETITIQGSSTSTPTTINYFALNQTTVDLTLGSGKIVLLDQFGNGANLRTVDLGSGLLAIGKYAFQGSGFSDLTIPQSLETIDEQAFAQMANLSEIKFGSNTPGITSIHPSAFSGTSITSVQYCGGNSVLDSYLADNLATADVYCDASVLPSAPTISTVSAGANEVVLTVALGAANQGPTPSNFAVEYSSDLTTWSTYTRAPASSNTSITVPNLVNEVAYQFRVAAINRAGVSSFSATTSAVSPQAARYGVSYLPGSGTGSAPTESSVFLPGESVTLLSPTSLNKDNFSFAGWSDGADLYQAGASYRFGAADVTFTAQWIQNSLFGIDPDDLTLIGSLTAGGIDSSITGSSGGSTVSIGFTSGGLPTGTVIDVHLLSSTSRARSLITTNDSFILSFVVAWLAPDGTVPTTAAGKAITMTIANPLIKAGSSVYSVLGNSASLIATASIDGTVTLEITEDPEIVITVPSTPAPQGASGGSSYVGPVINGFDLACLVEGYPSTLELSGSRMDSISSAEVDGKLVSISEKSVDSLKLNLPALAPGIYDITFRSSYGVLIQQGALRVCQSALTAIPETGPASESSSLSATTKPRMRSLESKRFFGFTTDKAVLSKKTLAALKKFVKANPGMRKVTCVGSTSGTRVTKFDQNLAKQRATAACVALKALAPSVTVRLETSVGSGSGKFYRAVSVFAAIIKP